MFIGKYSIKKELIFLILTIPVFLLITGFFNVYQSGNVKNDGSGSLNIVYSGLISEVVDNKYTLGSFPFGEKNVRDFFSSDNVTIKKLQIAKPGDTAYMVILDLDFKNITDLNSLKGFSDIKVKVTKADKGTELKWTVNSNDNTKLIKVLNFNMTFESDIVSTNGVKKDEHNLKWFKNDFSKINEMSVVLKSEIPASDNKESGNINTNKENQSKENTGKDITDKNEENNDAGNRNKICGLIGMELPFLMLAGFIFSYNKRKKRNR